MVCQYAHQNQEHVQKALSKLDSRIVTKTSDQTGANIKPKQQLTSATTQELHTAEEPQTSRGASH